MAESIKKANPMLCNLPNLTSSYQQLVRCFCAPDYRNSLITEKTGMINDELLQQGIDLAKNGDLHKASRVLAEIVKTNPLSEEGWLWLGYCRTVPKEKKYCLNKVLTINPNNADALRELSKLESSIVKQLQPSPQTAPSQTTNLPTHQPLSMQINPSLDSSKVEAPIPVRKNWVRRTLYLLAGIVIGFYLGAYIFNSPAVYGYLAELDRNIALKIITVPYSRNSKTEYGTDIQRVFGLFPRLKEPRNQIAGTLSGGEQQMLATGRALMAHPTLLLMDERSMGLAPVLVELIFETIQQINKEGVTVLLVEQNALMALSIANRGYVLQSGVIVLQDAAEALKKDHTVQKAYLGME